MKTILTITLMLICSLMIFPQQPDLMLAIKAKEWQRLEEIFSDESFQILRDHFQDFRSIEFVRHKDNHYKFKMKFKDVAEIGSLTFNRNLDGTYREAKISNLIKPLYFVDGFQKYLINNETLKMGDATVYLKHGFIYQAYPVMNPLIFVGEWLIEIDPSDEEERQNLKVYYKKRKFYQNYKSGSWGILVVPDVSFLKKWRVMGRAESSRLPGIQAFFELYRKYFGVKIEEYNEHWFLKLRSEDHLVFFPKDRKILNIYYYNENSNPDTQLRTSTGQLILSYNRFKQPKLSFGSVNTPEKIRLNIFVNPQTNFISGSSTIWYKNQQSYRTLQLHKNLNIRGSLETEAVGANIIRKDDQYHVLSPDTDKLAFFFSGRVESSREYQDTFGGYRSVSNRRNIDDFYYLPADQNYYPNPGPYFVENSLKISIPLDQNCLASGKLNTDIQETRKEVTFNSEQGKGISLIFGNFVLREKLPTDIPIYVYSAANFNYSHFVSNEQIALSYNFLKKLYGPPASQELNILFRRWYREGGVSHTGLIILNVVDDIYKDTPKKEITFKSSVLYSDRHLDYVIHELAHQWWGGRISWKSYRDAWITEGLAQFSTLYYLRKNGRGVSFNDITAKIRSSLFKKSNAGPLIYGKRILNFKNDLDAYQNIIYNKAALVFLMCLDILGEEEFFERLRTILKNFSFQSVSSEAFIDALAGEHTLLLTFFDRWVFQRATPQISTDISWSGSNGTVKVRQKGTDFPLPVRLEIQTEAGRKTMLYTISGSREEVSISEQSPILSIKMAPIHYPYRLKK